MRKKLLIATTVPETFESILAEQPKFLNEHFDVTIVTSPGDNDKRVLSREGVPIRRVLMKRGINPIKDIHSIFRMILLIKKIKPDIVHSYTPKAGLVCMLSAWICRVPYRIHTFTGLIWPTATGFRKMILMMVDRLICICATNIVPESKGVKRDLELGRITRKNLKIIGHGNIAGIDTNFFSPKVEDVCQSAKELKKEFGFTNDCFIFVYVGRLNVDKGLNELINAFDGLANHCQLLIVGAQDKSAPISSSLLKRIETHERIHCLGFKFDVRPAILAADVLVLPSYREGFPNVILQAGAMEKPVIATNISGCNELIKNDMNGWLVSVKDSNKLMHAMQNASRVGRCKLKKMGHYSRSLILKYYERGIYWCNLLNFYYEVIGIKR